MRDYGYTLALFLVQRCGWEDRWRSRANGLRDHPPIAGSFIDDYYSTHYAPGKHGSGVSDIGTPKITANTSHAFICMPDDC